MRLKILLCLFVLLMLACISLPARNAPISPTAPLPLAPGQTAQPTASSPDSPSSTQPLSSTTAASDQSFTEYTNGDLWVRLFSPQDESVVNTPQISLTGQAPTETIITVNDEIAIVSDDQSFSIPLDLQEGPNVLECIASDLDGNEVTFIITITYEP